MKRFFEKELPAGYTEAFTVDAGDKKSVSKIGRISLIIIASLFTAFFFAYVLPNRSEVFGAFSFLKFVGFFLSYFLYVILHELTHGAVYKLLTGQKLTFAFKPPAASCGVPDIFVYRSTSLVSLFAPFTLFTALFAALFFLVGDPFVKMLILALGTLHVSGCAGDLYGAGLLLFRFRDPATLRKDTGPKQIYYVKTGNAGGKETV